MRGVLLAAGVAAGLAGGAGAAMAQDSTRAALVFKLGATAKAPDFVLPAATREGAAGPFRLSDFRGKTVVLAFFFKARTKG